ncbi:MAG: hypothetical protein ACJAZ8_002097 [Planctomycetota bacterium]|jgi:hypothetical protein
MTMPNRLRNGMGSLALALGSKGSLTLAMICVVTLGGCGSPGDKSTDEGQDMSEQAASEVWTDAFTHASLLVADRVVIEGPKGLMDHIALRQDAANLNYSADTLPEGFRQVLKRKDPTAFVEIVAGLDNWKIVALDSVMVLERPGDVEVRVVASGRVSWHNTDDRGSLSGETEQRGERLVFRGGK